MTGTFILGVASSRRPAAAQVADAASRLKTYWRHRTLSMRTQHLSAEVLAMGRRHETPRGGFNRVKMANHGPILRCHYSIQLDE